MTPKRLFLLLLAGLGLAFAGTGAVPAQALRDQATPDDMKYMHAAPPNYVLDDDRAEQARRHMRPSGAPGEASEGAALLKKAGVDCRPVDGRALRRDGKGSLYEIVCRDGLGWDVAQAPDGSVAAVDCLAIAGSSNGLSHCILPGNRLQVPGLQAIADQAKAQCRVTDGVWIGSGGNPPITRYEVTCQAGGGYILDTPQPGVKTDLIATACKDAPGFGLKCTLAPAKP